MTMYYNSNGMNIRAQEDFGGDVAKLRIAIYKGEEPPMDEYIEVTIEDLTYIRDQVWNLLPVLRKGQDHIDRRIRNEERYQRENADE